MSLQESKICSQIVLFYIKRKLLNGFLFLKNFQLFKKKYFRQQILNILRTFQTFVLFLMKNFLKTLENR